MLLLTRRGSAMFPAENAKLKSHADRYVQKSRAIFLMRNMTKGTVSHATAIVMAERRNFGARYCGGLSEPE